jgi:hypothetical protein
VPPCDAVVIYGSTLSLGVVTVGIKGGLSHADDAVMATLRNELQAMRPLAAAWHFLLVDGGPSSQNTPVSLKRLLDESPWLQFTSERQRF